MPKKQLTVEQAAKLLHISVATVRRHCKSGKIKAERVGKVWVIDGSKLPTRHNGVFGSFGTKNYPGLAKVMEEAGEVIQVGAKLMATNGDPKHWDGSNLRERLIDELADLNAAMEFVYFEVLTPSERKAHDVGYHSKSQRFIDWHKGRA